MCRTWIRGWSRLTRKVLSASLSLVFPAHCLDSALLGGAKARRHKEEKEKVKLKLAIVCDNARFHHYYPGYAGNHFTRLRRHLGLKSDIFIKSLTSRFAKAIALSLNFPCVKTVTGTQTWRDFPRATQPTMDQQWHSQTSPKAPFPGDQGGPEPSPLPTVPLLLQQLSPVLLPPAHGHCCCQHRVPNTAFPAQNSRGTGSQCHTSHGLFTAQFSPGQPGIPSSHTQICHLAAARSSAS